MSALGRRTVRTGGCRAALGLAVTLLAAAAGDRPASADIAGIFDAATLMTTDGRQIYRQICQGCHMPEGQGASGAGNYPALARDAALASRQYAALTILAGRRNMPAFGAKHAKGFIGPPVTLSEQQIAAVVNYVRTHFGNDYTDLMSADDVRALDR